MPPGSGTERRSLTGGVYHLSAWKAMSAGPPYQQGVLPPLWQVDQAAEIAPGDLHTVRDGGGGENGKCNGPVEVSQSGRNVL